MIRNIENKGDGHFLIENRGSQAFLCIYAPGKGGRAVRKSDVAARLRLFGVTDYDDQNLDKILATADGQWWPVGTWHEPESKDASFTIEVASDHRLATITIEGPTFRGKWLTEQEIHDGLYAAGIRAGVDDEVILSIVNRTIEGLSEKGPFRKTIEIAKAVDPIPARQGRIRFYFDPNPRVRPATVSDAVNARVDFKNLDVIQTCEPDTLIAELISSVASVPGVDVTGQPIDGDDAVDAILEPGQNTKLTNGKIFATASGQVMIRYDDERNRAKIDVIEVLTIERIDYATGHVDFPGTVIVQDTVTDGFHLKAKGDIIIEKTVSNAVIQAGGDIVLSSGAVGRGVGFIEAGNNVYAKFVQETTVLASNGIYIEEAAIHSRLMAGSEVILEGGRGELIGGITLTGKLLIANRIGSKAEPETQITLGIDPETFGRLRQLDQEIEENRSTLVKVEQHRHHLDEVRRRGKETAEQEATFHKLTALETKYQEILNNLYQQRETLQLAILPNREAQILYHDTVFANVEVSFGYGIRKYRIERRAVSLPGRFALDKVENKILHSFE